MATGNITWFNQAKLDLMNKVHNLGSDTLNVGIVTTATVPTATTAAPHWGGTGTTNFATTQVATGGTQYTGPKTLTSVTTSLVSGVATLRGADISMTIDASGFTNGAWGIIYNNTDTNKRALGFIELSAAGTLSLVAGPVTIDFQGGANDILTIT
jgi:hypothetical protein